MVAKAKYPVPEPLAPVPEQRITKAEAARLAMLIIDKLNMFLPDADCHRARAADVVAQVLLSECKG